MCSTEGRLGGKNNEESTGLMSAHYMRMTATALGSKNDQLQSTQIWIFTSIGMLQRRSLSFVSINTQPLTSMP